MHQNKSERNCKPFGFNFCDWKSEQKMSVVKTRKMKTRSYDCKGKLNSMNYFLLTENHFSMHRIYTFSLTFCYVKYKSSDRKWRIRITFQLFSPCTNIFYIIARIQNARARVQHFYWRKHESRQTFEWIWTDINIALPQTFYDLSFPFLLSSIKTQFIRDFKSFKFFTLAFFHWCIWFFSLSYV